MRVVFLDFDGVLNELDSSNRRDYLTNPCEPHLVARLNQLVAQTGAVVVVSSSWRNGSCLLELRRWLTMAGFKGEVFDHTPGVFRKDLGRKAVRGDEIALWLEHAKELGLAVERFVILDDDADMLPEQLPRFVRTVHEKGLQDEHVILAVRILSIG